MPAPLRTTRALSTLLALLAAWPQARAADEPAAHRFEFSGTQRSRFESLDHQFRAGFDDSDDVLALQTSLNFDLHLDHVQLFGELMDSRGLLNDESSFVTNTADALEPIQAYVAWQKKDLLQAGSDSTVRVGRMTLDLGKRRILGRNRFRNVVNNFTGIDWHWHFKDGRDVRALYFLPMRALPSDFDGTLHDDYELDRALRGARLLGLYYQLPAFGERSVLETYVLDYRLAPHPSQLATAVDVITPGARLYRPAAAASWNYEIEAMLQRGESGGTVGGIARDDLDHRAYFLHLELGYQFKAAWSPNVVFLYDLASGDKNPADDEIERFNPLFGPRRFDFGPTGIYGPFARSNIDTPGVRVTFKPQPKWQMMFTYRGFALAESRDQWVGSGWRDTTGAAGTALGRQLEGSFTWAALKDRLTFETGFAHLWLGRFAEQTAGTNFRGDALYVYTSLTTTF